MVKTFKVLLDRFARRPFLIKRRPWNGMHQEEGQRDNDQQGDCHRAEPFEYVLEH